MEEQNQLENFFNVAWDTSARASLKQAANWAKICAICAFIGYVIALAVAFFGQKRVLQTTEYSEGFTMGSYLRTTSIIGTLITVAIGATLNYFLYRFAVNAARGLDSMESGTLNEGLGGLRTYFKIYGILVIIALGFAVLAVIVVAISSGISSR